MDLHADPRKSAQCRKWKLDAVKKLIQQKHVSEDRPLVMVWNITELRRVANNVKSCFPENWTHTFALKASQLLHLLHVLKVEGIGAEAASLGELSQAVNAGFDPNNIVFDSPTKTRKEIRFAIENGVNVNLDNFQELERLEDMLKTMHDSVELRNFSESEKERGSIATSVAHNSDGGIETDLKMYRKKKDGHIVSLGIRVNTEVGTGSIDAFSTSAPWSKFGVGLKEYGSELLEAYGSRPWLNAVHCHVGSQGCPLELMLSGIRATVDFAIDVNRRRGAQQIRTIDIGGGLPVNFADEVTRPTFGEWSARLRERVPELFSGEYRVLTEFGRAILQKTGITVSLVEYCKQAGGRQIVLQHAGADLMLRTIWAPKDWPLRVWPFDSFGDPRVAEESETAVQVGSASHDKLVPTDVGGPCCTAGDVIAHLRPLPRIKQGDFILVHDTGSYCYSSYSRYNARQAPALFAYDEGPAADMQEVDCLQENDAIFADSTIKLMRETETVEETLAFFSSEPICGPDSAVCGSQN